MKGTEQFKIVIQNHLNSLASSDQLFAETLKKTNKNIDDCITYIFNQVKASGCNGFADEEVFGMAVHYYDEDDIKVGKAINANVIVNHSIEKIDKNKPKVEVVQSKTTDKKAKVIKFEPINQVSLFDFPGV